MEKNNLPRKSFIKQFLECKKSGLVGSGKLQSFKKHPELLPVFPTPRIKQKILDSNLKGLVMLECLRFGEQCRSQNPKCLKMRTFLAFLGDK